MTTTRKKAEKPKKPELVVNVGLQGDGYAFQLDPTSMKRLREGGQTASLPPRAFVAFDVTQAFQSVRDAIASHIVPLLTGLNAEQIKARGGVTFYDPWNQQPLGEWPPAPR